MSPSQGIEVLNSLYRTSLPFEGLQMAFLVFRQVLRIGLGQLNWAIEVSQFGQLELGNLGNWSWAIWVKHTLQTKLTETITLHANTKEIITVDTLYGLI